MEYKDVFCSCDKNSPRNQSSWLPKVTGSAAESGAVVNLIVKERQKIFLRFL